MNVRQLKQRVVSESGCDNLMKFRRKFMFTEVSEFYDKLNNVGARNKNASDTTVNDIDATVELSHDEESQLLEEFRGLLRKV